MHPVDLLAPVSPISWDNIALRGVQAPTRSGRDGKRLNSTDGYTFLLATLGWTPRDYGSNVVGGTTPGGASVAFSRH